MYSHPFNSPPPFDASPRVCRQAWEVNGHTVAGNLYPILVNLRGADQDAMEVRMGEGGAMEGGVWGVTD